MGHLVNLSTKRCVVHRAMQAFAFTFRVTGLTRLYEKGRICPRSSRHTLGFHEAWHALLPRALSDRRTLKESGHSGRRLRTENKTHTLGALIDVCIASKARTSSPSPPLARAHLQ
jgi:hypothetical protein